MCDSPYVEFAFCFLSLDHVTLFFLGAKFSNYGIWYVSRVLCLSIWAFFFIYYIGLDFRLFCLGLQSIWIKLDVP